MNNNFKYYENDFELAVLDIFDKNEWKYECGYDIHREKDDVILYNDFKNYLNIKYGSFSDNEINLIIRNLTIIQSQSLYRTMKETYTKLIKGYELKRDDGSKLFINYIDFDEVDNNIFKVVNQFEFSEYKDRRPDIIAFINGIRDITLKDYEEVISKPANQNKKIKEENYKTTATRKSIGFPFCEK